MTKFVLFLFLLFFTIAASAQQETIIYFDFDKYNLTEDAQRILDFVADDKRIVSIEIFGHCDQLGTPDYNYQLSEKRADAVKDYLVRKGLNAVSVKTVKGLGKDYPAINKYDELSRQANRRVTLISTFKAMLKENEIPAKPPIVPSDIVQPSIVKPNRKESLLEEIADTGTKAGRNIILKNINFYPGSHKFLPMAYPPLEELLDVMQNIPTLVIEIHGHICCRDDQGDGWDYDSQEPFLSYNRARAVYFFLLKNGIDKSRMSYKGFGHKHPIILNEINEAERTTNRRVEIRIVKK